MVQISSEATLPDLQTSADRCSSASKRRQQVAMGDSPWNTINRSRSREAATGEGSAGSLGGGVADSEIDVRCRLFEASGTWESSRPWAVAHGYPLSPLRG